MAKTKIPDLKFEDLKVGQVYRGKKPKLIGFFQPLVDDRQILYISEFKKAVGHIDHGYHKEFEEWCKPGSNRYTYSELDQLDYESQTGKPARNIETIWDYMVQYESPSVKIGQKRPMITAQKFIKWAASNVTEILPKGEWAKTL